MCVCVSVLKGKNYDNVPLIWADWHLNCVVHQSDTNTVHIDDAWSTLDPNLSLEDKVRRENLQVQIGGRKKYIFKVPNFVLYNRKKPTKMIEKWQN